MSDAQGDLAQLHQLIERDPGALAAAGSGDIKTASAALSSYAASKGVSVSPEDVESAFAARSVSDKAEPLDDAVLDQVAGGGSPWCFLTKGCYCFGTH